LESKRQPASSRVACSQHPEQLVIHRALYQSDSVVREQIRLWTLRQPICSRPFLAAAYPPDCFRADWRNEAANRAQASPTGIGQSNGRNLARSSIGIVLLQTGREDFRIRVAIKSIFLAVHHREDDALERDV
jgi:hypothetical protein